jgi:Methyltransferase domain
MTFTLDKVVPWGRSYAEYVSMFDLTTADLACRVLGCGDGPAGFNTKLTEQEGQVVSVDPIYMFDALQIQNRIAESYEIVMAQVRQNQNNFVWDVIPSIERLGEIRMSAMDAFLADFEHGKQQGRYVVGELPSLPFANEQFDIALSSHFLFLYSAHLSADFHRQAIAEMLRVAREVRIFPLLALDGSVSPYLSVISEDFSRRGFAVQIRNVAYEFQRGGNQMLVIKHLSK